MFWSQIEDSSINDILIKEEVTLEEVLDHESLLQECRSQNENLIKFLTETCNYCKLLTSVLVTPSEEYNENIRFKYSSLSCEVLTSDIPAINALLIKGLDTTAPIDDFIGVERPFVDQVFDILSHQENINPLTLSFCMKILLNILKFDNEVVMKSLIENSNCLDVFLSHIDSNAIVHFFTEFVQCEDDVVETRKKWLVDNKFLLKLANLLGSTEYRNNSVQLIFYNILWYMSIGLTNKTISTELIAQLNELEFLSIIFAHISNFQSDSSLVCTCLKVIKNIVEMEIKKKEGTITLCLDLIKEHFKSFVKLLNEPPKQMYDSMSTTVGIFQPFGPTRIEIVNLIECLVKLENADINDVIINSKILDVLLIHVSEYKWNSQFHLSLLKVLNVIFSNLSVENKYISLQKNLVQEFGIYRWFFELQEKLESTRPRPGYSGILWKIGNLLDNLKNSVISSDLLSGKSNIDDKWLYVVNDYLKPKNISNEKGQFKIDSGIKELDLDLNTIDNDEADIGTSENNYNLSFSDHFRIKSDKLDDDIFSKSLINSNEDEWIKELEMPSAPIDDYIGNSKTIIDSDDSTSSDEESPAVIRQKPHGKAEKYISSDFHTSISGELGDLPDVPLSAGAEFSSLEFIDPWDKISSENLPQDNNWAKF